VLDPHGPGDRPVPPGAEIRVGVPRSEVHELLRSGAVVVMPSVRLRRWREQIGLPLVEGLAHGCRVVTTTETGLAEDLRTHPLVVLTRPGDPASLADGLRRAMDAADVGPGAFAGAAAGPGHDGATKRDVVAWWLSAGPGAPRSS
jgi:glycosyltransferase involved in cell wall biosynthesis